MGRVPEEARTWLGPVEGLEDQCADRDIESSVLTSRPGKWGKDKGQR